MSASFDHNKLLKTIAKKRLTSYGIVQKGSSRTFLKDNGWYLIVIEFQPSGFDTGSYLNIGADFNFYPRDYFAFIYGYREKDFLKVDSEAQFEDLISDYCDHVIKRVNKLETDFNDIHTGAKTLEKLNSNDPWEICDLAILCGLNDNLKKAVRLLNEVKKEKCTLDYEFERHKFIDEILVCVNNKDVFLSKVKSLIHQTRKLKKLPIISLDDLTYIKSKSKQSGGLGSLFRFKF